MLSGLGGVHFKDDSKWQFSVSQKWSHIYFLLVRCLLVWLTCNLSPKANVESLGDHNMTAQCWHDSTKYFLFKIMFETSSCQTLICVETENNILTTRRRQEEFARAKSCRWARCPPTDYVRHKQPYIRLIFKEGDITWNKNKHSRWCKGPHPGQAELSYPPTQVSGNRWDRGSGKLANIQTRIFSN